MPFKDPQKRKEMQRVYSKRCFDKNPEAHRKLVKNRKKEIKKWFLKYKKTLKCSKCPESDFRCLDFNHLKEKKKNISKMIGGYSIKSIMKEIDKCVVMCSNCHRKSHNGNRWK